MDFNEKAEFIKKTIYEHIYFSPPKAISYLPNKTIENILGMSIADYVELAEANGMKSISFSDKECIIKSGATYVFNEEILPSILSNNKDILLHMNINPNSHNFIMAISAEWFDGPDEFLNVIRAAFGDENRE